MANFAKWGHVTSIMHVLLKQCTNILMMQCF